MMWVLVVISFAGSPDPYPLNAGIFNDMYDCFWAREYIIENELDLDEYNNPINAQAICVRVEEDMLTSP
mgnify:FL=1